tara:strand:- start:651 stop:1109 length:459 start_codon:yes stop_codon:yes gene_type:complete
MTPTEKKDVEDRNIDLAKNWNAYSREVRVHVYVDNIEEMTRFYNQILEFPVVSYWRGSDSNGSMIDVGGNIIELFSKSRKDKKYFGNCSLSMRVPSVERLHAKFSRKNITIGELTRQEWGDTNFELIDPEGNRILFFSPHVSKKKYYKVGRQ